MPNYPPSSGLSVEKIKGVGPAMAQRLAKLGIFKLQDLLFHLPLRYLDRSSLTPLADLQQNTSVVVQGRVNTTLQHQGKRRSLVCILVDETGQTTLRFYHYPQALVNKLQAGTLLRCYGDPRIGLTGLEFYHPELEFIQNEDDYPLEQCLTPIYPLTEGISQTRMRQMLQNALAYVHQHPPQEWLPSNVNQYFGVSSLSQALQYVHQPPLEAPVSQLLAGQHPSQQRLAFEELLAHHFAVQSGRQLAKQQQAPALPPAQFIQHQLLASLGFNLTQAQQRVIAEISQDLQNKAPMLRMVQGDVGSGKTLVAACAALQALAAGYQVALVAPTEILAEQHRLNFTRWLEPLGFSVGWLAGKVGAGEKKRTLEALKTGQMALVVGTHALFEDSVQFNALGLVIIDEQHRFGVAQRLSLRQKTQSAYHPHQLVMTATPIPRTLAMTAYADLDLSIIDQLPPGRTPINTLLVQQNKRDDIIQKVAHQCAQGRQAYWVCTLVEESETLAASAATALAEQLQTALPHIRVGLVHGRLKAREKETIMEAFKSGQLQLLVATTVIEVGVDVPNASLMIIENPERLGLAQLHQLRGRVGRGSIASHCVLLYGQPLSRNARERLQALRASNDGFYLAEQDLKLRGAGELLGTKQTGGVAFRIAQLERDAHLIERVQTLAKGLYQQRPEAVAALIHRWFGGHKDYLNA